MGSTYNVRRAWTSYDECQDSNGGFTEFARIHVVDGCSESYTWFGTVTPKTIPIRNLPRRAAAVDLRHDPSYGAPEYSYPVRRARPFLVPNP